MQLLLGEGGERSRGHVVGAQSRARWKRGRSFPNHGGGDGGESAVYDSFWKLKSGSAFSPEFGPRISGELHFGLVMQEGGAGGLVGGGFPVGWVVVIGVLFLPVVERSVAFGRGSPAMGGPYELECSPARDLGTTVAAVCGTLV